MLRPALLALVPLAITPFSCEPRHQVAAPKVSGHYRVVSPGPFDDSVGAAIGHPSPDGKWSVALHDFNLDLTNRASQRVRSMYRAIPTCCTSITWLPPHLVIFEDNYRVEVLDPTTRHLKTISEDSNFIVSPGGRWIAGYQSSPHDPSIVDVVSTAGGRCLVVPRKRPDDDTPVAFTRDGAALLISRGRFDGWDHGGVSRTLRFALRTLKAIRC